MAVITAQTLVLVRASFWKVPFRRNGCDIHQWKFHELLSCLQLSYYLPWTWWLNCTISSHYTLPFHCPGYHSNLPLLMIRCMYLHLMWGDMWAYNCSISLCPEGTLLEASEMASIQYRQSPLAQIITAPLFTLTATSPPGGQPGGVAITFCTR